MINVFISLRNNFLNDLLFYFSHDHDGPDLETQIAKHSAMVGLSVYSIRLRLQYFIFIKILLLILFPILQHIFQLLLLLLLLLFEFTFIATIDLIVNIFGIKKHHQNAKQQDQLLETTAMYYFGLSGKDHFIFNSIRMWKLFWLCAAV